MSKDITAQVLVDLIQLLVGSLDTAVEQSPVAGMNVIAEHLANCDIEDEQTLALVKRWWDQREHQSTTSYVQMHLRSCLEALRDEDGRSKTRELALAATKIQEAIMWIGENSQP